MNKRRCYGRRYKRSCGGYRNIGDRVFDRMVGGQIHVKEKKTERTNESPTKYHFPVHATRDRHRAKKKKTTIMYVPSFLYGTDYYYRVVVSKQITRPESKRFTLADCNAAISCASKVKNEKMDRKTRQTNGAASARTVRDMLRLTRETR